MISTFDVVLLLVALGIFAWGFERYRRRYVKIDFLIFVALAVGVILLAVVPDVYDWIGDVINIENRFVVVSMLANLTLLVLVLYFLVVSRSIRENLSDLTRSLSVEQAPRADGGAERIFVVIPAYNEADTIRNVLKSLPETIRGYDVQPLVVSDGSSDDTVDRAKYNGTIVVEHPINQGQGGALRTGFQVAQENDASIVVTMDGDGQHPSDELENLVSPIIDDEADYVMGSRYLGDDYSGNGPVRRAGIRCFTALINVLTKSEITDCTNGFRAIRGSMLDELTLAEERFSAPELIIEARKIGMRIKELPITIEERKAGKTKKPQLGFAIGLLRTIFATWLR